MVLYWIVPNEPCGVESIIMAAPPLFIPNLFLMNRVELKAKELPISFSATCSRFLMNRVELKGFK